MNERSRSRLNRRPDLAALARRRLVVRPWLKPGRCRPFCCAAVISLRRHLGRLRKLGEDVTETLEVVPRQWKVIQRVREKFTCRDCERISQAPAPFHVIARGWAGPSLLAMILFEKFGQHQPLNRQAERYAREGVPLSLSTLADQVGACCAATTKECTAVERINGRYGSMALRLPKEARDLWPYLMAADDAARAEILAVCVASSVTAVQKATDRGDALRRTGAASTAPGTLLVSSVSTWRSGGGRPPRPISAPSRRI
jgi:transposase